jgi:sodium/hydrogen antiporter
MEIGLRLPKREFLRHLRSYVFLLGALMPIMWLVTGLLVWLILGLPFWLAMLIGAVLTPTDPIVASSIVTGPVAEKYLPQRLRDTLWAESGANDGLAYPFVILPILIMEMSFRDWAVEFVFRSVLYDVVVGSVLGAGLGYLSAKLLMWAERKRMIDPEPFKTFTLALSLTIVGIGALIGVKALLAVFLAGVVFHLAVDESEDEEVEGVQGAIDQFVTLPVFTLIGITIPLDAWLDLGWQGLVLVIAILLVRRLPGMMLIHRRITSLRTTSDSLFVGWFGPIGIGALYYAAFAFGETGHEEVWAVGSLVICASVLVHGITASPFSRLHARIEGHTSNESG